MFFEINDEEKKLFEDIQFKRRVVFVDDDDLISIEFKSQEKKNLITEVENKQCQVNIQNELTNSFTQTRSKRNKEIQTEFDDEREIEPSDSEKNRLRRLLEKRTPLVEDAITENINSKAFLNYDVDWYGGGSTITNPFTLINKQLVKEEELHVVAVEWNSTGSTICCAYGRYDHESVCTHKGALCTWNIDRIKIDINKPDVTIETSCCITALAPHPEYPGIIAVGFFNGEIHVYDIRQTTDPLVASITDKNEVHRDEVTCLKWIKDPKTSKKKYLLLSASKDGKILIWNALPTKNQLKLTEGFIMLIDNLPRNNFKSLGTEMGVTSLSVNSEDKDTFMIGCESGGLFKCSLSSNKIENSKTDEEFPIELKSPVQLAFDPQYGPIYSTSYSPFHRNLLLTCGTDCEVKLYSLIQTSSLMNFCPESGYLYAVDWSPTRPCVFACGTHKGCIAIYDLMKSGKSSCETAQASDSPIYSLSFNKNRPGYLATGDGAGYVKVWRLSQNLTIKQASEASMLETIHEKPFEK